MSGRAYGSGACGNVICALASFFIPGLGQLLQGRWVLAGIMFVLTAVLWLILLGWVIHLWSIVDAAIYKPERREWAFDGDRYDRYNRYRDYRRHRNHERYYKA